MHAVLVKIYDEILLMKTLFETYENYRFQQRNVNAAEDNLGDPIKQRAWARAMEQEQMMNWFQHGVVGGGSDALATSVSSISSSHSLFVGSNVNTIIEAGSRSDFSIANEKMEQSASWQAPDVLNEKPKTDGKILSGNRNPMMAFSLYEQSFEAPTLTGEPSTNKTVSNPPRNLIGEVSLQTEIVNVPRDIASVSSSDILGFISTTLSSLNRSLIILNTEIDQIHQRVQGSLDSGGLLGLRVLDDVEFEADSVPESVIDEFSKNKYEPQVEEQRLMRFHSEFEESGVRIWLGVDQKDGIDIVKLTAQLKQWLAIQNLPLISLICNGRELMNVSQMKIDKGNSLDEIEIFLVTVV